MARIVQFAIALVIAWLFIQWLPLGDDSRPGPDPTPPGPVDPEREPDFSKYETPIFKSCMAVKSRTRKADCEKLSGDISKIINEIENDRTLTTNQQVVDALVVAFRKLPTAWYGQIKEIANKVLQPLTSDGTLSTPKRWAGLLKVAVIAVDRAAAESTGSGPE